MRGPRQPQSAGLLVFRRRGDIFEVLLVHPGGPYWANKDNAAWSIPKGEFTEGEEALAAAKREFEEETGSAPPSDGFIPLEPIRQPNGKVVQAWAVEGDFDPATLKSNTIEIEWPPRSGRRLEIPEVDRAEWFTLEIAARKIFRGQARLLEQLAPVTIYDPAS